MATSQQIMTDVDLRYRNTFTTDQKLVWFNEEQQELFDILELDSPPYAFTTVAGENYYPFPDQFDVTKIKVVSYQVDDTDTPNYVEIDFKRNDDNQYGEYSYAWYTIVSDAFYLYVPDAVPADRTIYIYCDSDPTQVSSSNIGESPDLPTRYQEILKIGVLKRIAGARKDIQMYNNYDQEHEQKLSDIIWEKKMKEPEFSTAVDMLPRVTRGWRSGAVVTITG